MSQKQLTVSELQPNYRLETPIHLQYVLVGGLMSGIAGLVITALQLETLRLIAVVLLIVGALALTLVFLLLLVTRESIRHAARRRMMNEVAWRGDENVLDVGCGNGYLLIEAARNLNTGKATGIDIWDEAAGGQTAESAHRNASVEGVADKVDVQNVDARRIPYADASFDVVMSSLALHHMGSYEDRQQALNEMIRVLKPGGKILLYDMFPMIGEAAKTFQQHHFSRVKPLGGFILTVLSAGK